MATTTVTVDDTLRTKLRTKAGAEATAPVSLVNESGFAARPNKVSKTSEGTHLDVPVHYQATGLCAYVNGAQVYPTDANVDAHAELSEDGTTITVEDGSGFSTFVGA